MIGSKEARGISENAARKAIASIEYDFAMEKIEKRIMMSAREGRFRVFIPLKEVSINGKRMPFAVLMAVSSKLKRSGFSFRELNTIDGIRYEVTWGDEDYGYS